jgi:hypothetical protein
MLDNRTRAGGGARWGENDIDACLAGKAYIAVLKHRLTKGGPDRTFRDIFDEAYRAARREARDIPTMSDLSQRSESYDEQIESFVAGKAYIAVLKHRLANGPGGRSAREIFDEAYRAASDMARPEPLESLGLSRAK